ncbi:hypothetical protein HOLleu_38291 [Holothuria leucospilota]|uniref:Uncharacterized protein n=1 Tax=Holothuria leucospilota TaxID=206669 RepID=A0A9Q0YIK0_HOLLE|nr:hypothetical protein HOLleu_38291 [Holothuria leucospilota]
MASSKDEYRSEWICVDCDPQLVSARSVGRHGGAYIYPVEATCGLNDAGLPCSKHPAGNELTCAVCTM